MRKSCFVLALATVAAFADRVALDDRFDKFDAKQSVTLPATGPRGSLGRNARPEGGDPPTGVAIQGFGAVQYRIGNAISAERGSLELEFTVRFDPEHTPTPQELKARGGEQSVLCLFVPGGRVSVWIDPGTKPTIGFGVYEEATQAHLLLKRVPVAWKQGEKHRVTVSWGDYLRFAVDGQKAVSSAFRGLHGPWGQTKLTDTNAILILGSLKNWADTYSDITVHHLLISEPTRSAAENIAAAGGVGAAKFQPSTLAIPRLNRAPTVDGVLSDGEWDAAAALAGLMDVSQMADMKQATTFYIGYDDTTLYVAARCYRTQAETTDAATFTRDGAVFMDDAIEVYLVPAGGKPHIQFIGNSFGTIYDALDRNPDWNGKWQFKTRAEDDCWTGELAIAFSELRRPAPAAGESWAINFCRDLPEMSGFGSWAFLKGAFDQPEKFSQIQFAGTGPVMRLLGIAGTQYAEPVLTGELVASAGSPTAATGEFWLYDADGVLATRKIAVGGKDARSFSVALKPESADGPAEGEFIISYLFTDAAGNRLLSGNYPFTTMPAFALSTAVYPTRDELDVTFDLKGMRTVPAGATARASLLDPAKKILAKAEGQKITADGTIVATVPLRDVPPGRYPVLGELLTKDGRVIQSGRVEMEKKPAPWWLGRKAGVSDVVFAPWTPMTVAGNTVACWGREVAVAEAILPTAIVSQGKDMLAGPVSLSAVSAGTAYRLQKGQCRVVSAKPDAVRLATAGQAGPLTVKADLVLEYDGFIRVDLELAAAPGTKLEQLSLDIPLRAEHSILFHHSTGSSGYAGMTPAEPWTTAFLPMLWLGDDRRGLSWFCESNRGWNAPGNGEIELVTTGDTRLLRINFIRQPVTFAGPRAFTFGLMSTPVKPVPAHFVKGRLNNTADPVATTFPENLAYPAKGSIENRAGSLQFVLEARWPDPATAAVQSQELLQFLPAGDKGPMLNLTLQPEATGDTLQIAVTPARDPKSKTALERKVLLRGKCSPATDKFRQVALSWGDALVVYADGVAVATLPQAGLLPDSAEPTAAGRLTFGDTYPWAGRVAFALDELAISRSPLSADAARATAGQRPAADTSTLLLDRFDEEFRTTGMNDGTTVPERGVAGGIPSIGCRFVPGKFGKALAIHPVPARNAAELIVKDWKSDYVCDWSWNEHIGDPYPGKLAEKFAKDVKAYHALGAKVYPYTINYLALRNPDHDYYINEWMAAPLRTWRYPAEGENWRNYDGDSCCANSAFSDYFLATYEKTLKEYDLDGVYIDGSSKPDRCMNEKHGCGWRDETGTLRGIYPIFATRDFIKRLYTLVHTQRPDGILDNHSSFNLFMPTSSFSDIMYTGEHEPIFRLDMMRVRMAVGQWGIPVEGLGDSNHCFSERQWAYYALHGAVIRPQGTNGREDMQRKTALIRDTLDEFRLAGAKWLPYHDPQNPVTALTPDLHASTYQRPDGQLLLVVVYLGKDTPVTGKFKISVPAGRATNALTLRPLALADGVLEVPCAFEQMRLIRLQP